MGHPARVLPQAPDLLCGRVRLERRSPPRVAQRTACAAARGRCCPRAAEGKLTNLGIGHVVLSAPVAPRLERETIAWIVTSVCGRAGVAVRPLLASTPVRRPLRLPRPC